MKPGDRVIYCKDPLLWGPMLLDHIDKHGMVVCEISNGPGRRPSFESFRPVELETAFVRPA